MPKRSSKLPRDPNQLAARIVAMSTGQEPASLADRAQHTVSTGETLAVQTGRLTEQADEHEAVRQQAKEKNPAAVALGRLGGMKGGKARAESLTAEKRSAIASKAARNRWKTKAV